MRAKARRRSIASADFPRTQTATVLCLYAYTFACLLCAAEEADEPSALVKGEWVKGKSFRRQGDDTPSHGGGVCSSMPSLSVVVPRTTVNENGRQVSEEAAQRLSLGAKPRGLQAVSSVRDREVDKYRGHSSADRSRCANTTHANDAAHPRHLCLCAIAMHPDVVECCFAHVSVY